MQPTEQATKNETSLRRVNLYLTETQIEAVRKSKKVTGHSLTVTVRVALERYLKECQQEAAN